MISQQTIQQILNRIDILDIVGGFVRLKKRGANYLGLCPFHNEKTPSFTVSPSKEIYKCFGCGRSGNSISFLMEHEKYSYVEALRWLAAKYNVEIEENEVTDEQRQLQQVADSLFIVNQFAQQHFTDTLFNSEEGRDIGLSYLKERGFREEIIRKFQIGYCADTRDQFAKKAIAAQYNTELLQKAGLVTLRDDQPVDNYRGRIIFPVHNQTGKVIGFGARIIKKNDRAPKYINTPENELYIKSRILYGVYFARQAIDKRDECLLVEGYTDVVSLHQAGIENVVASGGTSLTQEQLRLIRKYTNNLTIIYDGDNAGVKAALRGMDMALEERLNVQLVLIPGNEDPDSYVHKVGAAAFQQFIADNKKDVILFQLEVSMQEVGTDANKKAQLVNQVAETISKINKAEDFTKQQDYIRKCARILGVDESGLLTLVNKMLRDRVTREEEKSAAKQKEGAADPDRNDWSNEAFSILFQDELQERALVRVLLNYGARKFNETQTVADCILSENEQLDEDMFQNKKIPAIISLYRKKYEQNRQLSVSDFTYEQDNDLVTLVIEATNHPYELSERWNDDDKSNTVNKHIWELSYEEFKRQILGNEEGEQKIHAPEADLNYRHEVEDVLVYLKLKHIKKLMVMNEEDLKHAEVNIESIRELQQVHMHLKQNQIELSKRKGLVIYPF